MEKSENLKDVYMSTKEVAELLHVDVHTVRRWRYNGKIAGIKIGRTILYRREEVERLIAESANN